MAMRESPTMPRPLKLGIYLTFGCLWASGCAWLILHEFFTHSGQLGTLGNPWEPSVLRVHGWIAVLSVFLLGWVTARHVSDRWSQSLKRASGYSMVAVALLLAL